VAFSGPATVLTALAGGALFFLAGYGCFKRFERRLIEGL
jgi:hypothetical protein